MVTRQQLDDMETVAKGMTLIHHREWDPKSVIKNVLRVISELHYADILTLGNEELEDVLLDFQNKLQDIENKYLASNANQ